MRRLKTIFACLLMAIFSVGQVWGDATYKLTQVTSVTTGELYVFEQNSHVFNNTCASSALQTTATYSTTGLSGTESYIWTLESATGGYYLKNVSLASNQYLNNASKTTVSLGSASSVWTISFSDGVALIQNTSNNNRYLGQPAATTYTYKAYATSDMSYQHAIKVYKLEEEGEEPTQVATPSFSLAAGSYEGTQSVTISCSTAGATIYYTTNGGTPSSSSTEYEGAITVSATQTIKAIAIKDGLTDSEVAEAAYTITAGPDVTINLLDAGWGFPTSKVVEETSYTNGDYTIKVAGTTGNGFRVYDAYFLFGQNGAYLELPEFDYPIEKIVVAGNSGGSANVTWNIFNGDDAVSTAATGCKSDAYTFNIDPMEANVVYRLKVTNANNLQIKTIKIYYGAAPAVAKPSISGKEEFITSTSVSMSCSTTGAAIYYTLNGSDPQLGGATLYEGSFSLSEEGATVNARAKLGDDWSGMVSKTFTKVTGVSTMAEVQAAATTTTDQPVNVVINNWVVTAVSGSQVWFTDADNAKGILLYKSGHGFTAGKKLNGEVVGTKVKLYNSYPELTSLVASEVTVTDAEAVSPRSVTIPTLTSNHPAEQGTLVKLDHVTYSSATSMLSDGVNTIAADNKFFSSLALVDGTTYNITGIVTYYKDGDDAVVKIAPRTIDDVVAQTPVVIPTAANLAALKAAERGTYILTLTNAVVSYVNGKNAFIEDATGGALIFYQDHGFTAGDCLNGDYQVVTTDYQGKFEITAIEPQAGAATTTAAIPLTTVSIATLNAAFSSYESRRIKIAGANVTDAISGSDRNGAINDGAALAVYAAAGASTITLTADDNVDIIGYPGFHNTDQQLNVWAQADITVNEKDPAGISFTPESETITGGDAWSAPTFANPNNLDVSFGTDNDEVATVSNAGVVSLEGGYGTAVITAHTDGDATHNAGNATYTITVNDPASVDTRKVAESPEGGFSSISGNLSGNEISFAAYQGGAATAPNGNNTAHELRLYKYQATTEYGGYVTITAKSGCLIDQVVITVSANCNVGWCKDAEALPTKEDTPIAIGTSSAFDTGTGLDASSVSVVNLDGSNQFKIKTITVYYNGDGIDLQSIAISGTASVLEYNDGDEFNPAGLVVTGHYSDDSDAEITDGIIWAFDPATLSEGDESVSVTATVGEISSSAFVVDGLTVGGAAAPTTDNVVILAVYDTKYYAMSTTNANNGFTAIAVEYNGSQVTVNSAEDKAAIQWTRTTSSGNTTFQDADDKYMKSADGASMSLDDNVCNWSWDATGGYYKIAETSRTFFFQNASGGIFKNYATSNLNGTGYSDKAQVIVIDPANIVITSKVSAELAYDPASDEITEGDAWSAPSLVNPYSVTIASYASDNEAVATVTDGGVIALAGGIGTAHITAHFAGDASYLEGDAVYTITVNAVPEPADVCDGTDDFLDTEDKGSPTSYTNRTTPNGWSAVNAGYKVIDEKAYWMINGKTTAVGVITSPELTGGLGSLKFRYANTNSESNGVSVKIEIKQGGDVVKEYTLTKPNSEVVQNTVYTELIENINVAGTFQIVITNLSPSNNTGNKDRVSIGRFCWSSYSAPEPPVEDWVEVRTGLSADRFYTLCYNKTMTAIKGASLWQFLNKDANFAYIVEAEAPYVAGTPYLIYAAEAGALEAVVEDVADPVAGNHNGLYGTFDEMNAVDLLAAGATHMLKDNMIKAIGVNNHLDANRAYIKLGMIPGGSYPAPAGRRVKAMPMQPQEATGLDNIFDINADGAQKLLLNGQLIIIREGKMYDTTGRVVK